MGNQQTKLNFEIGWLVGILDGEGWFILAKAKNFPSERVRYVPTVGVNATSKEMIEKIGSILQKHNIGHWIKKREFSNKKWKDQWMLVIRGMKRVKKILPIVKDSLIVKSKQANLLYDFIRYRERLNNHDVYGEKEEWFFQEVKRLNRKGKVPTTKGKTGVTP